MNTGVDNTRVPGHTNTDPNGNGVGQVPDTTGGPGVPTNDDPGTSQPGSNAPHDQSQGGTTFEELAQKKGFQSPDDMAKSYANLEREFHGNRGGSQTEPNSGQPNPQPTMNQPTQQAAPAPQPAAPAQPQRQQGESQAQYDERLRRIETRFELQDLQGKYSDVGEYSQEILEKVKATPGMQLEDAYWAAKGRRAEQEAHQQGFQEGQQQATQTAEAKMRAATQMPGARTEQGASVSDKIKDANSLTELQEIERTLPHG